AAGAIVSQNPPSDLPENFAILRAADTLVAYQNLAANYLKTLPLKVLSITGRNGKTATKDFAASILGRAFRVTKTEGNFNNHVGLPRTILEANRDHQFADRELGMNHPREIDAVARSASRTTAGPWIAHGAKCHPRGRRWACVWGFAGGMRRRLGLGPAGEGALADPRNPRCSVHRRQLQRQSRFDESGPPHTHGIGC